MSRGPLPARGLDAALPVALARGHVMFFRRTRGYTADLMVSGNGILAIIAIRNAPQLYGSLADLEAEFRQAIALLRLHPAGGPVSRELWLYSRYGALRYFRVEDPGIVELCADGSVMKAVPPVPVATRKNWSRMKKQVVPEKPAAAAKPEAPAGKDGPPAAPGPAAGEGPAVSAPGSACPAVMPDPVAVQVPGGPG